MKIIIPMAGRGDRFLRAGYDLPKPLLLVDGKEMIEHVVNMFPGENDFLFICNGDQVKNTRIVEILNRIIPRGKIKVIDSHKKGPVFSVVQVFDKIDEDEPVIVNYCDFSQTWDYEQFKKDILALNCAGAIPSFTGFHPTFLHNNLYAGVLADKEGMMTDIKEKHYFTANPAESFHSSGTYYFRSGGLMKKYFQELLDEDINFNGEYYISMVYYLLKRDNLSVFVPKIDCFLNFGTPEELEEYEAWSRLIHRDLGKTKALTSIPAGRKALIKIPYDKTSQEFQKSYDYWKNHFIKIWSM